MNALWEQIIGQPVVLAIGLVLISLVIALGAWLRVLASRTQAELARRQELEQQLAQHQHENELQQQRLDQVTEKASELDTRARELDERGEHWRGQATMLQQRVATLEAEKQAELARADGAVQERDELRNRRDELSRELESVRGALQEQDVVLDKEREATNEKLELLERNQDATNRNSRTWRTGFQQKSEQFSRRPAPLDAC